MLAVIYYMSWIFIGNYILLNLFLAIILDSFLEEDDEEEEKFKRENQRLKELEEKTIKGEKPALSFDK